MVVNFMGDPFSGIYGDPTRKLQSCQWTIGDTLLVELPEDHGPGKFSDIRSVGYRRVSGVLANGIKPYCRSSLVLWAW